MKLKYCQVFSTIDITLTEYNYLANHLHPEECRKLIAALYFKSYNKPNSLDEAERRVPEDIPCLRQLIHWNNAEGEGVGETHEVVMRSLQHIDRYDLADWLGKTVFKELGQELDRDLGAPFEEFITKSTLEIHVIQPTYPSEKKSRYEWKNFDSICISMITVFGIGTILLLIVLVIENYIKKKKKHTKKISKKKNTYQYSIISGEHSESECEDTPRNNTAVHNK